ncbi:hypothetical protein QO014_002777 [Kaistia dalseonensis]|uniref:Uncharacterized protein n=1 Tax=Kaistia dalseonensis TaxID=410840 RepID=A0ABU0H9F9_9HYPH|nr:hypothetical protein [Kaistia dalseonensis]MDQ0438385.1 hypothetical protein [Kaistia dalseonensis]
MTSPALSGRLAYPDEQALAEHTGSGIELVELRIVVRIEDPSHLAFGETEASTHLALADAARAPGKNDGELGGKLRRQRHEMLACLHRRWLRNLAAIFEGSSDHHCDGVLGHGERLRFVFAPGQDLRQITRLHEQFAIFMGYERDRIDALTEKYGTGQGRPIPLRLYRPISLANCSVDRGYGGLAGTAEPFSGLAMLRKQLMGNALDLRGLIAHVDGEFHFQLEGAGSCNARKAPLQIVRDSDFHDFRVSRKDIYEQESHLGAGQSTNEDCRSSLFAGRVAGARL